MRSHKIMRSEKIKKVLSWLPNEIWTVAGKLINQADPLPNFSIMLPEKSYLWEECSHTPKHVHGKQDKSRLPVMYVE